MTVSSTAGSEETLHRQRGQLTILFALGLFTLLLFVSLTVNIGQAVVRRYQVQLIADAGALAGASVQARGLNLMTRLNALSLRIFNTFQLRSRVGGYLAHRIPLLSTAMALLPFLDIPEVPVWPDEEDDAFEDMQPVFDALRTSMKAANYYYEIEARKAAFDLTERNVKALVGQEAWNQLMDEGYVARPVEADWMLGFDLDNLLSLDNLEALVNVVRGASGDLSALTEAAGIRPLIPEFADPDGDILIARYWTDLPEWEKWSWAAAFATAECAIECAGSGPFYGLCMLGCVPPKTYDWKERIDDEGKLRFILGPAWHEMRVTLHREDDPENDTYFIFWARLPTTRSALGSLIFADMPSMVAFSAAKPIGGNFGTYPQPESIAGRVPGAGAALGALEGVMPAPTEHLEGSSYDRETPTSVHGSDVGDVPNVYWYEAVHLPTYRPRLFPVERRFLGGTGFSDLIDAVEELNLPEDFATQIELMIQLYEE